MIVEDRCKAEALVSTKPLDYFADEKVIQPSRLHALALHISSLIFATKLENDKRHSNRKPSIQPIYRGRGLDTQSKTEPLRQKRCLK
jgi:hypothetical protein